jgi:hypothetical protein
LSVSVLVRYLKTANSWSTCVVSSHVAFRQPKELVAFGTRLHDFFEGEVHVSVALNQMAVESFAILELDEHGVALGGGEEAQRELGIWSVTWS